MIRMTHRDFVRLVRRAYAQVPEATRRSLENVDVMVEEWPGPDEADLIDEGGSLFGLFSGQPLTEIEGVGPMLPHRIVIYRQPILRHCNSREEAEREIQTTLWHEIGHYLGMTEEDLHRLGYG